MKPKFDLYARSRVLRAEKPTKPVTAIAAANQHQMNRVRAFLSDGVEVMVAQRSGKGGMDFNKILSGKVYAVAADAFSPVMDKGPDKKPTKVQTLEEGLPLYSSSGFYMLSSPEYPALDILECFTRIRGVDNTVLLMKFANLKARTHKTVTSAAELEAFVDETVLKMLDDSLNLVKSFDPKINKKRKLLIDQTKLAAASADDDDDAGGTGSGYTGVEYQELTVSPKDGNSFAYLVWASNAANAQASEAFIVREREMEGDKSNFMAPCTAQESLDDFKAGTEYSAMLDAIDRGETVKVSMAQGHSMRPSPMFRNKITAAEQAPPEKRIYGDPVYILGALTGWTPGIVSILHSKHPAFPAKEYDHLYYTVACRQAEVGLNKTATGYTPPQAVLYNFTHAMLAD